MFLFFSSIPIIILVILVIIVIIVILVILVVQVVVVKLVIQVILVILVILVMLVVPQTVLALGVLNSLVGKWGGFPIFSPLCRSSPLVAARLCSLFSCRSFVVALRRPQNTLPLVAALCRPPPSNSSAVE